MIIEFKEVWGWRRPPKVCNYVARGSYVYFKLFSIIWKLYWNSIILMWKCLIYNVYINIPFLRDKTFKIYNFPFLKHAYFKFKTNLVFPGGPVVKTPHCSGCGFHPWSGSYDIHMPHSQKNKQNKNTDFISGDFS